MSLNRNINDDSTLAYLFNKTRQGASDALEKAVAYLKGLIDGKVSKTGDTMSGALNIFKNMAGTSAWIDLRNNDDLTVTPTAAVEGNNIYWHDKNGKSYGMIRSRHETNGQYGIWIAGLRSDGQSAHGIHLRYDQDGNAQVALGAPAAWRTALNAVNKAGDTMTNTLIIQRDTTIAQNYPSQIKFQPHQTDNNLTYTGAYVAAYDDHDAANNGANMVIQSGSNMIIGSGESPSNLYTAVYKDSAGENMIICGDGTIEFFTNCQTIANRVNTRIDASGNFTGKAANVTGTVAIANGGTGQTGTAATITTVADIATAATGFTITSASYSYWGKMAMVNINLTCTTAVTVTSGTIMCTLVSGKRPKLQLSTVDNAGSRCYVGTDGTIRSYKTIAANATLAVRFTYLLP